ncbi:MAG: PIG-L family deacetylase [Bacteroidota bacterium]|nr:PIG-L family deacetylase [Bacteroidota bacterium]MDP4232510.1 PIG-L family deacetylase [Bacteroidota bacterium]MDP4241645.1 PIG-L family deacetylase [Bacteroidota bacterium]MDP4286390.1 PIG-L family deacetylase [Bacteroidota bacterium]
MIRKTCIALLFFVVSLPALAQRGTKVLIVDAHPDDETAYAATIYKLTHELGGSVDLCVITNGEAGYKYSTLAEPYYQLKLTNEDTGRKYLPRIRHQELENAGTIIGLGKIYFLDQRDNRYTLNPHEVLDSNWNIPFVKSRLQQILGDGHYDFVFTLLPTDSTHGHHKAASILALEAVKDFRGPHPIILAGSNSKKGVTPRMAYGLAEFPITHIASGQPEFSFDRTQSFGFHHALNYKIVVNWEIAEHKSQGTMQLGMNEGDIEDYYYYDINPPEGRMKAKALFDALAKNYYPEVTYPGIK